LIIGHALLTALTEFCNDDYRSGLLLFLHQLVLDSRSRIITVKTPGILFSASPAPSSWL
jgi:hypothetical protein